MGRNQQLYERDEVEALIAEGRTIFILDGAVVKADAWRKYHPGGDKAILHMVGRDATDEVTALHSKEARQRMNGYVIGRVQLPWHNFVPPIQGGHFRSRDQIQAANAKDTPQLDTSSDSSSAEPSPVFEAADRSGLRRRREEQNDSSSRSTSATSISSIDVGEVLKEAKSAADQRTEKEIEEDLQKYPSLDNTTQANIVQKYRQLDQRVRAEGLYQCNYSAYAWEVARYSLLFALCILTLRQGWYAISGAFLGCFWHQLTFIAHDAGHMGITHDFQIDTGIGILVADFLGGLSIGWWKRNHNVHHIVTNSPEHDPDIEHMPFFAISHRFFDSLRSTYYDRIMTYDAFARFTIKFQHYLYYPILLFGRFNLYRLSWEYLLLGQGPRKGPARLHRWFELAGMLFFWTWFGYGMLYRSIPTASGRIVFALVSHMITASLHVQITLSHFAMSTADLGVAESFPQRMLRTTMDVDCPPWLDFFHGGLQFQAIHHLYPRVPRHNLRRAQQLVQDFCDDVDIPYVRYGFVEGNKEVISRLGDIAKQARIMSECKKHIVESGDYHAH